ncbi:phospholipid carrier-dependent glycosyltransferase [Roseiarcus sp.]|uniref:phospholipid carrier-dependent glycosyltransferase n=1 Tax=Roseiarcus sp. TaxID=1969460 RepID=UPI003C59DB5A
MSFANGRWVKDWIAPKPRTVAVAIVVVFALSLAAFLWDVDTPNVMMFDETWYVPTAQKWLAAGKMMHEEHPPLGKLMIALGMWLFGDNPFGWRVMSAVSARLPFRARFCGRSPFCAASPRLYGRRRSFFAATSCLCRRGSPCWTSS